MPTIVPSIGFVGLGQMDRASQLVYQKAMGARGGMRSAAKRRRNGKKKAAAANGSRKRRRSSTAKRLVKGSAAAKRYMAKIRKKRK